jgi:hypothetical protein
VPPGGRRDVAVLDWHPVFEQPFLLSPNMRD